MIIISFGFQFIASFWSQNLILLAKLWATWATIVLHCLSMGYHWATFVCSPLVAHKQLSQIHMTFWLIFTQINSKCDNNLVWISIHCLVLVSKFNSAGKAMGYMGYHCFALFKHGLPLGYFCL